MTGRVVGSYRITSSAHADHFEATTKFDLRPLFKLPGLKLELGRLSLLPHYRRETLLKLLWCGVREYALKAEANYLFGCATVPTTNEGTARAISKWLGDHGANSEELFVSPHPNREFEPDPRNKRRKGPFGPIYLPPLFSWYLKTGARIASAPALDKKHRGSDFLMLVNRATFCA